jgi:hypothetical protein
MMNDIRECTCPACGGTVRLLAASAAGPVRCPHCHRTFTPVVAQRGAPTTAPAGGGAPKAPVVGCLVAMFVVGLLFVFSLAGRGGGLGRGWGGLLPILFIVGFVVVLVKVGKWLGREGRPTAGRPPPPPKMERPEKAAAPAPPPLPPPPPPPAAFFHFGCPHCGKRLEAEEGQRGLAAVCPGCQCELTVPPAAEELPATAMPARKAPPPAPAVRRSVPVPPAAPPPRLPRKLGEKAAPAGKGTELVAILLLAGVGLGVLLLFWNPWLGFTVLLLTLLLGLPALALGRGEAGGRPIQERHKKLPPRR